MVDLKAAPDSWLARRYIGSRRWIDYLTHSVRALHEAVWLGLLNREQLAELTEFRYEQWSEYTESGYNLTGLKSWEEEALDRYFGSCQSVLVGAAGGGREVAALSHRALEVGAFECSEVFADAGTEILESANVDARILVAAPDRIPKELGVFDGFIMGWGGYMHIKGKARRIAFLEECRDHLSAQAPILLSFFTRSADIRTYRWSCRIANFVGWFRSGAERVETGDMFERTLDHMFTEEEIRSELNAAGFEMLHYSETPYGHAVGRLLEAPKR